MSPEGLINNRRLRAACEPVDQTIKEEDLRCKDSMQDTNQLAVGGSNAPSVELKVWFCVKPWVAISRVTVVTEEEGNAEGLPSAYSTSSLSLIITPQRLFSNFPESLSTAEI